MRRQSSHLVMNTLRWVLLEHPPVMSEQHASSSLLVSELDEPVDSNHKLCTWRTSTLDEM